MKYDSTHPILKEGIHVFINNVSTFGNRIFMSSIQRFDVINSRAITGLLGK